MKSVTILCVLLSVCLVHGGPLDAESFEGHGGRYMKPATGMLVGSGGSSAQQPQQRFGAYAAVTAPIAPVMPLSTAPIQQHAMLAQKTAKLVAEKTPPQPQNIVNPANAPILPSALPLDTQWNFVNQPIEQKRQSLPLIELQAIHQPYTVHSTTFDQENIKQPITEPVFQPYLQRYIQQAHPVVQPVLQRVVQPVVHREMHSYLQTKTEQAPDAAIVVKPTDTTVTTNAPIRGGDLAPLPISKTVTSFGAAAPLN